MENGTNQDQEAYVRVKPEPRERWSCVMPVRVVKALKRYSATSGIPQATIVVRATEQALRNVGAL